MTKSLLELDACIDLLTYINETGEKLGEDTLPGVVKASLTNHLRQRKELLSGMIPSEKTADVYLSVKSGRKLRFTVSAKGNVKIEEYLDRGERHSGGSRAREAGYYTLWGQVRGEEEDV